MSGAEYLLRAPAFRYFSKDDDSGPDCACFIAQRPATDSQMHSFREASVTHEHLHLVAVLAANGAKKGELFGREGRLLIGVDDAVVLRPAGRVRVYSAESNQPLGRGIEEQEAAMLVGEDDTFADAVHDGLEDPQLVAQAFGRVRHARDTLEQLIGRLPPQG